MTSTTFSYPAERFDATTRLPGDKSLGHRSLIFAAIAAGDSTVGGLPEGLDVASTRKAIAALGVDRDGSTLRSPGRAGWTTPSAHLDCGNSGTTMRLLAGALASSRIEAVLVGDVSLSTRPMGRLVDPLSSMGAHISVDSAGVPPVTVRGRALRGAEIAIPMASAQVRTAVALAALGADGPTWIDSPPGFRDHTERWLATWGRGEYESVTRFRVDPGPIPQLEVTIPGDPSSAAYVWAAAALRPGARVVTPGVSANPGRLGFLEILQAMGTQVEIEPEAPLLGDPVATITVIGGELQGIDVDGALAASALDELTLLAVVASAAEGRSRVRDAAELRHKESDRIAAAVALAHAAGAVAEPQADGFDIDPGGPDRNGGVVDAAGDHRIAMAGSLAALASGSSVTVVGAEAAAVSWPGFAAALEGLWS